MESSLIEHRQPNAQSEPFVEFEVKYAGLIPDVPCDLDLTCRTDILRIIDQAKATNWLAFEPPDLDDVAVLAVSASSVNIRTKHEKILLLCAPVHMISAVCFVKEESCFILGIKIGEIGCNKDIGDLAVLYCDTEELAVSVFNRMSECFQSVFTEATMQYFDKKATEGGVGASIAFMSHCNESVSSAARTFETERPAFLSNSRNELNRIQPSRSIQVHNSSTTTTQSDLNSDRTTALAADLIQDYMRLQFAILLKRWRTENLPFTEFCQKVLELYGSERKHLLAKIAPFVADSDVRYFESLLEQIGLSEPKQA